MRACRESGRDVLEAERLDAEEGTEAETLVARVRSDEKDVHLARDLTLHLRRGGSSARCQPNVIDVSPMSSGQRRRGPDSFAAGYGPQGLGFGMGAAVLSRPGIDSPHASLRVTR